MARIVQIHKTGNTTILTLIENGDTAAQVFSYNKKTNLKKGNGDTIEIEESCGNPWINFKFSEYDSPATATNAAELLEEFAENFFFY